MGPLLFLIYTSDILKSIRNCSYQAYADDTQVSYSFLPHEHHIGEFVLNKELNNLSEMSRQHNLVLNPGKSVVVSFGGQKIPNIDTVVRLRIEETCLPVESAAKSLGILIDSKLNS